MQNIYTVAQINSYIKNMFTQDYMLQSVLVKGEVSNCKYHSSGHIYFTLKDAKGTIACVMFASYRNGMDFQMREGQQVVVGGSVDVYERDGKYQLYARQIQLDGAGALYERYERLKLELEERGMFAPQYKQPIPGYIRTLGVVTAATGAAVRDIMNIAGRRNPYVQIILYPAIVQGDAAPASIVNGIHALERMDVDVIIVGRGGGSIEDLWAFNEEVVAQAIFDCPVPVISAVGHETDTTIADFVADLRAPTPSAAAELAVYDIGHLEDRLEEYACTLQHMCRKVIRHYRQEVEQYSVRMRYLSPLNTIRTKRTQALSLEERLQNLMERRLRDGRHRLALYVEQMKGLSPLDKLNQGYAYVADDTGRTLTSVGQVDVGDRMTVYVKDGSLQAQVMEKKRVDR
ncbi:MAG: exodeoxyribonuclease VII large subunit [Lachnospiraceae bacterium]|nr:exodeoxyribonuclease VII large subunit [Lachnospiraceae bacterium]MCI9013862.1 exodeoxyribonuclease VII large subunit [Lachnospiraceae bacterium]MCI9253562.1 exodeoxyribonuclease VII large subunit [Lachnospiraceae bacterium]